MALSDFMGLFQDTMTLYKREMLVFKSNLRVNLIRSITFPLILIIVFGSLGNTTTGIHVTIVNYANNPQSNQFISALTQQGTLSIQAITNQDTAMSMLRNGAVSVVIVILPGFPSNANGPSINVYYANNFAALGNSLQFISSAASKFGASVGKSQQLYLPTAQPTSISFIPASGTQSSYKDFITASVIVQVALFGTIFGSGISIISDRQLGNLKAFLITPINKRAIVFSKIISGTSQSVVYSFVAILIGFANGANIAMGPIGIVYILILSALLSFGFSGLTLILASRINKIEVYAVVAQAISLPLWFISGAFFPTTSLPSWLYPISLIDPMTYATNGIRSIMQTGYYPLSAAMGDVAILVVFSVVCIALANRMFKTTIE